jgi:hypothetical protein
VIELSATSCSLAHQNLHHSAGAFGRVYKALRNNVQEVAVKVLTHGCDEVTPTNYLSSVPSHAVPHMSDISHGDQRICTCWCAMPLGFRV